MNLSANMVDPVPVLSETRSYIVINKLSWQWKLGIKTKGLFLTIPRRNINDFFLLRDFHGRADGKVLSVASMSGGVKVFGRN
jgi:hypothetical protein